MKWKTSAGKLAATITFEQERLARPFFWNITGALRGGALCGGHARTLAAAKGMCAREIRYTTPGIKLTWEVA